MSIPWPKEIRDILIKYHSSLKNSKHSFSAQDKNNMVTELINTYKRLKEKDQAVFLVPTNGEFLDDCAVIIDLPASAVYSDKETLYDKVSIALKYKWPVHLTDGFVPGSDSHCQIVLRQEYDRIGSPFGKYLCPLNDDGTPESYLSRAIPYFIPDENDITSSPAYHRYVAMKNYEENDQYPKIGIIAQAFRTNPNDGGGKQVVIGQNESIFTLEQKGVLKSVK